MILSNKQIEKIEKAIYAHTECATNIKCSSCNFYTEEGCSYYAEEEKKAIDLTDNIMDILNAKRTTQIYNTNCEPKDIYACHYEKEIIYVAVLERERFINEKTYIVAWDYEIDTNQWGQGHYDFRTRTEAQKYILDKYTDKCTFIEYVE